MQAKEIEKVEGLVPDFRWAPGADPISQAARWVPERMYGWQVNVVRDCMVRGAEVSVVTPNESGKTSVLIPVLGLSWMAAFPGSKVVTTAGVQRQIEEQLWPVLKQALRRFPNWKITDDLRIKAPSVRGLPGSEWESFTTNDPDYAEGFHPRWYRDENGKPVYAPLLIIIDEAKAFKDDEMLFVFRNRCDPDALLQISTPGEDSGPFYDSFHKDRADWKTHEITWSDCPHLRAGVKYMKRLKEIERRGENHPRVLSWIFGKFYRGGGRHFFDNMQLVKIAMSGQIPEMAGSRRAAIEFSGGGDEQIFGYRNGNRVYPLEVFHEKDESRLCDILVERFRRYNLKPGEIIADNGGAGKTCIDFLGRMGYPGIGRYMFNDPARDETCYKYRAAEDHDNVRMRLKQQVLILPEDAVLEEQMRKRQYLMLNDDNRIQMEPKEKVRNRGEDSPDRLDNIVMLCADMEPMNILPASRAPDPVCGTVEQCMEKWFGDGGEDGGGVNFASGMLLEE